MNALPWDVAQRPKRVAAIFLATALADGPVSAMEAVLGERVASRVWSVPRVLVQDMRRLGFPEHLSQLLHLPPGSAYLSHLPPSLDVRIAREGAEARATPSAGIAAEARSILTLSSDGPAPLEAGQDASSHSRRLIAAPAQGETEALMRIEIARQVRSRFDAERFNGSDAAGQRALLGAIWGEWERAGLVPVPTSRTAAVPAPSLGFPGRWEGVSSDEEPADRGEGHHDLVKDYRVGGNNRRIISAILDDLEQRYGVMVEEAYGKSTEVRDGKMHLSEAEIDHYMDIIRRTQEIMSRFHKGDYDPGRDLFPHWEAMLRFIIAHEYFHLALMHLAILEGRHVEGFSTKVHGSEFKRLAELQANYLAADYLEALGLPTKYPASFLHSAYWDLETGEETEHPDYPPGWMQRRVVEMPKVRIHWGLFRNEKLDAVGRVRQLDGIQDGMERALKRILYLLDRELGKFKQSAP